jgi:hypothetical protein
MNDTLLVKILELKNGKSLNTGISLSLHRSPVEEHGGDLLAGTFERTGWYMWVPFLDPEDIKIFKFVGLLNLW